MCPIGYYNMVRSKNHIFDLRLRMVQHADKHGIRATARAFKCSRNTVRKWVRRYREEGRRGLMDRSRAPHSCPHKLSPQAEKIIIRQARKTPGFGARHLKHEFDLPYGVNSIARVKRENGITRRRRTKHQRRNDLRAIKQACKPFTRFQMDVKYLDDIPNYCSQMRRPGLPRFQYTIREIATGAQFLSYADSISVNYAELTVRRFLEHIRNCGIDTTKVHIQTDNGVEFEGRTVRDRLAGFVHTIESLAGATHTYIPPGCSNANADVESVHATIETEFFDIEYFTSRNDFFAKVTTYQLFYNLARKNGSRNYRSPLTVLHERDPTLDPKLYMLLPCDLDRTFRNAPVGHHVLGLTVTQRLSGRHNTGRLFAGPHAEAQVASGFRAETVRERWCRRVHLSWGLGPHFCGDCPRKEGDIVLLDRRRPPERRRRVGG